MRLIDADDIPYTMLYKENWMKGTGEEAQGAWKSDIDKMPTIDAVPVVRCKECKHKGGFGCPWWKGEDIPTDWYCANGERMTDATD